MNDLKDLKEKQNAPEEVPAESAASGTLKTDASKIIRQVCLILLDAREGVTEQDTKVAGLAHDSGKASVIIVNKWDLIDKETRTMDKMREDIRRDLSFMPYAPIPTHCLVVDPNCFFK